MENVKQIDIKIKYYRPYDRTILCCFDSKGKLVGFDFMQGYYEEPLLEFDLSNLFQNKFQKYLSILESEEILSKKKYFKIVKHFIEVYCEIKIYDS